jgi:type IV secretory pathway VirB10-like protein
MTALTKDMTRLWGEIETIRGIRAAFISRLKNAAMERRATLSAVRAGFARAHAEMARATKADRLTHLSSLKRAVARQRQSINKDLSDSLRAWSGPTPAKHDAMESQQPMRPQAKAQYQENLVQRNLEREKPERKRLAQEKSSRETPAREKPEKKERPVHPKTQANKRKVSAPAKKEGTNATNEQQSAQSNSRHGKGSNRRR